MARAYCGAAAKNAGMVRMALLPANGARTLAPALPGRSHCARFRLVRTREIVQPAEIKGA